jgi:hypothetical protein
MSLSDEELHQVVEHIARVYNVSARRVVEEVTGQAPDEDEPPKTEPKKAKKRGASHWVAWGTSMVVMGLLVGVAVIAILKFINNPAEAVVHADTSGITKPTPTPDLSIVELDGQTFSLKYPHIFDQVSGKKPDSGSVEEFNMGSKSNYRRLIAVDIRREAIQSLADDASYRIRHDHPDTYKEEVHKTANGTFSVMTKNDSHEQTLFWLNAGKLMMISVTSTDANDNVASFMKVISDSVRWKS